jgi:hypothetical protein
MLWMSQQATDTDEGGQRITGDKQLKTRLKQATKLPQRQRTKSIADAKSLYIRLHLSGSQDWLFRYTYSKPRVMLFGHYPELSLLAARVEAAKVRVPLDHGRDPAETRREQVNDQLAGSVPLVPGSESLLQANSSRNGRSC